MPATGQHGLGEHVGHRLLERRHHIGHRHCSPVGLTALHLPATAIFSPENENPSPGSGRLGQRAEEGDGLQIAVAGRSVDERPARVSEPEGSGTLSNASPAASSMASDRCTISSRARSPTANSEVCPPDTMSTTLQGRQRAVLQQVGGGVPGQKDSTRAVANYAAATDQYGESRTFPITRRCVAQRRGDGEPRHHPATRHRTRRRPDGSPPSTGRRAAPPFAPRSPCRARRRQRQEPTGGAQFHWAARSPIRLVGQWRRQKVMRAAHAENGSARARVVSSRNARPTPRD